MSAPHEHVDAPASGREAVGAVSPPDVAGMPMFASLAVRDPRAVLALQRAAGNRATRRALARAPTTAATTAPKCSHVAVKLPGTMTFYGNRRPVTAAVAFRQDIAPGTYKISFDKGSDQFVIEPGPGEVFVEISVTVKGTQSQIEAEIALFKAYLASMATPVDLTVEGAGGAGGGAGGTGSGGGTKGATGDADAPAVKGKGEKGATGTPDASTEPPASTDGGTPAIEITDPKQIDELTRRGLIPVETADAIKAKVGTVAPLTFDEAVALLDAMNALIAPPKGDAKGQTSWLEWAKFVEENKDKMSGTAQTAEPGKQGLRPDDVKAIIAKEKEFVGIKDPPMTTLKDKLADVTRDPAARKSWNSLEKWERDLWAEYEKKHGGSVQSDRKNFHITAEDKFSMALRMSPDYMEEGSRDAARAMFNDPVFITSIMVGITAYLALWAMPEPVFSKATAVMTTIALASLVAFSASELIDLAQAWMALSSETKGATTLDELEKAAERFGKRIGAAGVRILLALAMVLLGKALPTPKAAPPMGPGGPTPVPVGPGLGGGAAAVEATASTVKIVNGVIVLVGPGGTLTMGAMQGQGGEGGGGDQPKPKDPGEEKAPAETSKAPESAGPSAAGTGPKPARPLKPPAARHTATRVTQRTLAKGSNTVIEPGVDVAADVAAINGGGATRVGGNYSVNGRTYGVHDGTLYPIDGPGLHPLSRGAFKALGVYNEFGNSARAADILARMGTSQADANAALRVWEIIHP